MEERIIQIPDTLEIKEIKDDKIILVEKEKKLTYEDVARKLFANKESFFITQHDIKSAFIPKMWSSGNNCTSSKQAEKLLAINMLMNVAKDLNDGWQPNWNNGKENKYYIQIVTLKDELHIDNTNLFNRSITYFKSKELAKKAIEILGEETIKLALCTDY